MRIFSAQTLFQSDIKCLKSVWGQFKHLLLVTIFVTFDILLVETATFELNTGLQQVEGHTVILELVVTEHHKRETLCNGNS